MNDLSPLLTPKEAAGILRIKLSTVYKMSMSNTIPIVKIAGSLRFRREELGKFIEDNSRKPIKEVLSPVAQ